MHPALLPFLLLTQQAIEPPVLGAPDITATGISIPPAPAPENSVPLPGSHTMGVVDAHRFDRCHDLAVEDPARAITEANFWVVQGGDFLAKQCLGFALAKQEHYGDAANAFAEAAVSAQAAQDWRSGNLWAQAGNAALASGDAASARAHFSAAIASSRLTGRALGLAQLDRARAALSLSDWPAARADLDLAAQTIPQDPLLWLLSATLARRQADLVRAQADIQVAATLGPRDAAIALEAGNIAAAAGNLSAARQSWESAAALGGTTPQGGTARARLAELAAFEAEAADPANAPSAAPAPAVPATTAPPHG